jgi:hypothetical protein
MAYKLASYLPVVVHCKLSTTHPTIHHGPLEDNITGEQPTTEDTLCTNRNKIRLPLAPRTCGEACKAF